MSTSLRVRIRWWIPASRPNEPRPVSMTRCPVTVTGSGRHLPHGDQRSENQDELPESSGGAGEGLAFRTNAQQKADDCFETNQNPLQSASFQMLTWPPSVSLDKTALFDPLLRPCDKQLPRRISVARYNCSTKRTLAKLVRVGHFRKRQALGMWSACFRQATLVPAQSPRWVSSPAIVPCLHTA